MQILFIGNINMKWIMNGPRSCQNRSWQDDEDETDPTRLLKLNDVYQGTTKQTAGGNATQSSLVRMIFPCKYSSKNQLAFGVC